MRILPSCDLLQAERRRRPADIDLAGHHRRQVAGRAAGRRRLRLGAELLDEATTILLELEPLVEYAIVCSRSCP